MRIAILTTQCPFVIGGAELHARSLERALREAGHEAEIVTMPFKWYPSVTILDHMLAARAMDVSEFNGVKIDLAIALKFPAYFMQHPNKVYWVLHQHRQAYDLWDSGHTDLFDDPDGRMVREAIFEADTVEFTQAKKIFANSANVAKRMKHFNNISSEPLYHPPPLATRLRKGEFGEYFYYPSRIAGAKRQDFVLRALAKSKTRAKVVFSGAPDNPAYGEELKKLAQDLGVADQVTWKGFVTDAEMIDLYAGARGILFTPIDEDLGYIALEAMLAGKPLLTLSDAGEPAALIRDAQEGFITPPDHGAFAEALDKLTDSSKLAQDLGEAGLARYASLGITWANAVAKLTGESAKTAPVAQKASTSVSTQTSPEKSMSSAETAQPSSASPLLGELIQKYHLPRADAALERRWPTYVAAIEAVSAKGISPKRILQISLSPDPSLTALMAECFPEARITTTQCEPSGLSWMERLEATDGTPGRDVKVHGVSPETAPLPFDTASFDLVVGLDLLEHFTIDPSHFFLQAERVLADSGVLLVATPNVVSYQSLARALRGASPYHEGRFAPVKGTYGRNNREYTPQEVESIGRYAGLETAQLDTQDVSSTEDISATLKEFVAAEGLPTKLRGEVIVYLGRKTTNAMRGGVPDALFRGDPSTFTGDLELLRSKTSADLFTIRITNRSRETWQATGNGKISIRVDRRDQEGLLTSDVMRLPLPGPVAPGASCDIGLTAKVGTGTRNAWYEMGLHADGIGPFAGAKRSRVLSLFVETFEPATVTADPDDAA